MEKQYYENLKNDIQKEHQELLNETYVEIERLVVRKINKTQTMQKKLQDIELKEKGELDKEKPVKK